NEQQTQDANAPILPMPDVWWLGEIPDAARGQVVSKVQRNAEDGKRNGKRKTPLKVSEPTNARQTHHLRPGRHRRSARRSRYRPRPSQDRARRLARNGR